MLPSFSPCTYSSDRACQLPSPNLLPGWVESIQSKAAELLSLQGTAQLLKHITDTHVPAVSPAHLQDGFYNNAFCFVVSKKTLRPC